MINAPLKAYVKKMLVVVPITAIIIYILHLLSKSEMVNNKAIINLIHSVVFTTFIWIGVATIVRVLWRKYPWEQNPIKHLLIEIALIIVYTNGFALGFSMLELKLGIINHADVFNDQLGMSIFITNLITFFITSIHEAVFFYQQWKFNFSKSARLERDNIEAKYETLKTQINPHFLFNSLNSLTTIVDENHEAVDYIQNLSEFLRYMLKSRDRELVLVRDEVKVLQKYISLQKSRFRDNLIIEFEIPDKFFHYSLPPLVLQMLVENSIKHNIISKDKPLTIKIYVEKEHIIVENNLQRKQEVFSTKQGLKNISDRISFFTTKEVKIIETNSIFKVEIPMLIVDL